MYSPVLRAKTSEWDALAALAEGVRRRIAPIFEFIPDWKAPDPSTTARKRRAPQTPEAYVDRMLDSSATATPPGTRSFVYFGHAGSDGQWSGIDIWSVFDARISTATRVIPLADLSSVATSSTRGARGALAC